FCRRADRGRRSRPRSALPAPYGAGDRRLEARRAGGSAARRTCGGSGRPGALLALLLLPLPVALPAHGGPRSASHRSASLAAAAPRRRGLPLASSHFEPSGRSVTGVKRGRDEFVAVSSHPLRS